MAASKKTGASAPAAGQSLRDAAAAAKRARLADRIAGATAADRLRLALRLAASLTRMPLRPPPAQR